MTTPLECAASLRQKVTCEVEEVLPLFGGGLGRTMLYESIRAGTFIVEPLRIGRRLFIPVAPLLRALGLDGGGDAAR